MFRLANPDDSWPATVEVDVPGEDKPQSHRARWRVLPDAEINRLLARQRGAQALLERALAGWEDVREHDGSEIPFSVDAIARLCEVAYWRRAAVDAYLRWVAGLPEKNSSTPPAAGGAAATDGSGSSPATSIH